MARVWLEGGYSEAKGCLERYFCPLTANILPSLSEKASLSQREGFSLIAKSHFAIFLFLMLIFGGGNVWGQTKITDGVYYFGSRDYNVDNTTTNYYLCPTENWKYYQSQSPYYKDSSNGQPFMTTYQCRNGEYDSNKALWVVKESPTEDWYYIIRLIDGKYLTYNAKMASGNEGRMRAHLEDTADGDNALFKIAYVSGTGAAAIYQIITKNVVNGYQYLNITGASGGMTGNQPSLQATNVRSDGPGGMYVGGILGLWTSGGASDNNSKWYPESNMLTAPTISDFNPATGKVTVTVPEWLPAGYNIRYTFGDGSQPAPTATTETYITNDGSANEIPITTSGTLKVVIERYDVVLSEVATKTFTVCETPVITYDSNNSEISITCVTEGSTIYYTTDGNPPTTSNTPYSGPFSVDDQTTIKAIATKSEYIDSEITSVKLVLTPTITLAQTEYTYNGSAIVPTVSSVKDGGTPIAIGEYTVDYRNNTNAGTATVNIVDNPGGAYIVSGSTTFTIHPKGVTLTANSGTKPYDGTEKTVSGFTCSVDGLTFEGVSASGSGTEMGDYPVTFTGVTIGSTKDTSGNYVVMSTVNGTLTISRKQLTITADSETKVYDGTPLTKNSYTHTDLFEGDWIESVTVTGSQTNAGTSNNVPSAAVIKNSTDDDVTANYDIIYNNGTLEVTKRTLTVTANARSKVYGEADPMLTYQSEGLINGDVITGTLTRAPGENAGDYAISQGELTAGDNYEISFTGANLTITKAKLKISAQNNSITYGAIPAGIGVTYTGFVGEETSSVLGGTLDYDFSYTQYDDVGNYTITPKGLTSDNYGIIFVEGKLTVSPKEVGLAWSETTLFTYNGSLQAPTATATGLVNDDVIGVTVTGAQTNAGNHTATASGLTGAKKRNYSLPEANTQSFTILSKSIGDGTLADGYTLNFGEGNTILLTDDMIGSALVSSTDYSVGEDTDPSEGYSIRTVTGIGNYTGSFNVRNAFVTFSTDTEQENWSATFVAEKRNGEDIGFVLPEGFSAFIISDIRGEWAIPEPLNYIPADVPVLLVANHQTQGFVATKAISSEVTEITETQKGYNMLEEVTEATSGYDPDTQSAPFTTKQIYLLYKNEFVFNKSGNLKKGKVYLNPSHTAPAPSRLKIAWNHTTGIENLQNDSIEKTQHDIWYTIDGRRLSGKPNTKGLYIVGAKKIIIK